MAELQREKVWDPLTRIWHWLLAAVVMSGWVLGEWMSFSNIRWHFYCGYAVLSLLTLRYLWAFVGPPPVRWRALLPRPAAVMSAVRGLSQRVPGGARGHNPLGALAVLGMLVLLTAQGVSGLFIVSDEFFESGPLAHLVAEAVNNRMTWWHKLCAKLLLVLVSLHLLAMLFYAVWKRENLVGAMVTGWKWVKPGS